MTIPKIIDVLKTELDCICQRDCVMTGNIGNCYFCDTAEAIESAIKILNELEGMGE